MPVGFDSLLHYQILWYYLFMSLKHDLEYYEERLKDRKLLLRAVRVRVPIGKEIARFYCVPCGGARVTGFTHFFKKESEANLVYSTLLKSGENFPMLRIVPVINAFDEPMFMVKWGIDEPNHKFIRGWAWEVAIAKQLGYNDECMAAHYQRCAGTFF